MRAVISAIGALCHAPALKTATSTGPISASIRSNIAMTASSSRASQAIGVAVPPPYRIRRASASSGAVLRRLGTAWNPPLAKRSATAPPSASPAPTTSAAPAIRTAPT